MRASPRYDELTVLEQDGRVESAQFCEDTARMIGEQFRASLREGGR